MAAISTTNTFYTLHLDISIDNDKAISQNSTLKLLLCIRDSYLAEPYYLTIITTDIGVTSVEAILDITPGEDTGNEVQYCLVGWFVLSWKSLIPGVDATLITDYADDQTKGGTAEQALIAAIKAAAPNFYSAVVDGTPAEDVPAEKKYTTGDHPLQICANTFDITGDFAGADVNNFTGISAWSLGNATKKWKNLYVDKSLANYTYSDTVAPQKNYTYINSYLRVYSGTPGSLGTTVDPLTYFVLKANSPSETLNFYQVDPQDPTNRIYSTQININGQSTTCYINLSHFENAANTWTFPLYLNYNATNKSISGDSGKYLERTSVDVMVGWDEDDQDWIDSGTTTVTEADCMVKIIYIGDRESHPNDDEFYCLGEQYYTYFPDAPRDNRIFRTIDWGVDPSTLELSDPLELDENGDIIYNHDPEHEGYYVTTNDLAISNIVYKDLKKTETTVGVEDNRFDFGYFKTLNAQSFEGDPIFNGKLTFNDTATFNDIATFDNEAKFKAATTFDENPKIASGFPIIAVGISDMGRDNPLRVGFYDFKVDTLNATSNNYYTTIQAPKKVKWATAMYMAGYNGASGIWSSEKRTADLYVSWFGDPYDTSSPQRTKLLIQTGAVTGDNLSRATVVDYIRVIYFYTDK